MFNASNILLIGSVILLCFIISRYASFKLEKIFLLNKKFQDKNLSFSFKIISVLIYPVIFFCVSLICFLLIFFINYNFQIDPFYKIQDKAILAVLGLIFKVSFIWIIYRIANLSSANKFLNKFFICLILTSSLSNFFGFTYYVVGFLENFKTSFADIEISVYAGILFVLIFGGIFWFSKIFLEILHKILETTSFKTNTKVLLIKFFSMVFISIAIIVSISSSGIDLKSLTIFGSALVVGLGFGFQKVVSNIISGITISFEEIIKEGDIIIIDDKREIHGVVKSLNMRYILVAEFDGKEVIVPNDTIVTNNISNLTHSNSLLRLKIELTLPTDIDLKLFRADALKIMNSNPYASKIEECVFHILKISEIGVHCFLYFWIDNSFDISVARTSLMFDLLSYINHSKIKLPPPISKFELVK